MFLINTAMEKIPIGTAALIVVLGMAVVFFGLILLMFVTKIAGAIIGRKKLLRLPPLPLLPRPLLPPCRTRPRPAPPVRSRCTTSPTRPPPCSWPSLQTGLASPSTSFASSPSAKSKTDRCF